MRCTQVRKLLSGFMDNELSERRAHQVRDHLSRCAGCRQALEQIERLEALSHEALPQEPSEAYWANFLPRLHRRIETAPSQTFWKKIKDIIRPSIVPDRPWLRTAGAVASVVLVFVIGWALLRDNGGRDMLVPPTENHLRKTEEEPDRIPETPATSREQVGQEETEKQDLSRPAPGRGEIVPQPEREKARAAESPSLVKRDEQLATPDLESKEETGVEKSLRPREALAERYAAITSEKTRWIYDQALQQQMTGATETAATQYQSIVLHYPHSPWADDAQFQLNVIQTPSEEEQHNLAMWQHQRDAWQRFLQTYPESDLNHDACLKLSESWYQIATQTVQPEDISQALEANRQCQQRRPNETALKQQADVLEQLLKKKN